MDMYELLLSNAVGCVLNLTKFDAVSDFPNSLGWMNVVDRGKIQTLALY